MTSTPLLSALESNELTASGISSVDTSNPDLRDFKVKSKTFPASSVNKSAHLFLKMTSSEITALSKNKNTSMIPSDLSPPQVQALKNLKTYTHLTIKLADKGGCIVVMDNDTY